MMRFVFAASGSKGNATVFTDGETTFQIDMGISLKSLNEALRPLNLHSTQIEALFITHDHSDHVKGIGLLDKETPLFCTPSSIGEQRVFEYLEPGEGINVGAFTILPFPVSHDAPNPVNFLILRGEERFAYITDTGALSDEALTLIRNCDYYLFEANYDPKMLRQSNRPDWLKKRIRGKQGHLSNEKSARYCSMVIGPKTKAIYLGHISQECNTPAIALDTYRKVFAKAKVSLEGILLKPTDQFTPVYGGEKA